LNKDKKPARFCADSTGRDWLSQLEPGDIHAIAECIRRANLLTRGFKGLQESALMRIWRKSSFDTFLPFKLAALTYLSPGFS
jgi:hypothetical protein